MEDVSAKVVSFFGLAVKSKVFAILRVGLAKKANLENNLFIWIRNLKKIINFASDFLFVALNNTHKPPVSKKGDSLKLHFR